MRCDTHALDESSPHMARVGTNRRVYACESHSRLQRDLQPESTTSDKQHQERVTLPPTSPISIEPTNSTKFAKTLALSTVATRLVAVLLFVPYYGCQYQNLCARAGGFDKYAWRFAHTIGKASQQTHTHTHTGFIVHARTGPARKTYKL